MTRRLIIEADGGSRGNPGPAAYGALVRDAQTGEVLAERAEFLGQATNNVAEYRGLIAGLAAVAEIDPGAQVEVRLDSKLVVEQMSGGWKIKNAAIAKLALQARDLLPAGGVRWTWVPRAQNAAADRLVNVALDAATGPTLAPALAPPPAGALTPVPTPGSPAALVAEFHRVFDLPVATSPDAAAVPEQVAALRQRLLDEEVGELAAAVAARDVLAVAHELADVVYVAYGTALTYGIDLDAVLAEVHRSNLSKHPDAGDPAGPAGRTAERRDDGKVLKGAGYRRPDVAAALGLTGPALPGERD